MVSLNHFTVPCGIATSSSENGLVPGSDPHNRVRAGLRRPGSSALHPILRHCRADPQATNSKGSMRGPAEEDGQLLVRHPASRPNSGRARCERRASHAFHSCFYRAGLSGSAGARQGNKGAGRRKNPGRAGAGIAPCAGRIRRLLSTPGAPIAQWIERRPPEPEIEVRVLMGVPRLTVQKT